MIFGMRKFQKSDLFYLWVALQGIFLLSTKARALENFIYCSEASPAAFNPQVTTDGTSNNAAAHTIYEKLTTFKYGSTEIIPALATQWTISKDQKTYRFKLRKGVKFHTTPYFSPTRDFNAEDVVFSFNRMKDTQHPFHLVGGGNYEYFAGMDMANLIKSVKKLMTTK